MTRSWKDVKAEKLAFDRAAGRDVEAARAAARESTQAYIRAWKALRPLTNTKPGKASP